MQVEIELFPRYLIGKLFDCFEMIIVSINNCYAGCTGAIRAANANEPKINKSALTELQIVPDDNCQ